MATSKIKYGFPIAYESDFTKFATPASGVTFSDVRVWQVERNIFYFYFSVSMSQSVAANSTQTIGSLKLSFFGDKPVTGIIPATIAGQSIGIMFQLFTNGDIRLINTSDVAVSSANGQGVVVRREIG